MPALSPTMEEGTLAKWLVKEGDDVKSGDILAEIETDKATMEFEAVDEGKIAKILVPEGTDGVKVGQPIALLAARRREMLTRRRLPRLPAAKARQARDRPDDAVEFPSPLHSRTEADADAAPDRDRGARSRRRCRRTPATSRKCPRARRWSA